MEYVAIGLRWRILNRLQNNNDLYSNENIINYKAIIACQIFFNNI
jgi:hypothetical protein